MYNYVNGNSIDRWDKLSVDLTLERGRNEHRIFIYRLETAYTKGEPPAIRPEDKTCISINFV